MDAEGRAIASEAYALWRDLAAARANPYGDHSGCLLAGRMAVDATRWEDGLTILAAIRLRMDEKSSPRWIPEWSRELGGSNRENTRTQQRISEGRDPITDKHIRGLDDIEDSEVRRVMIGIARAKAKGLTASLEDVSCIECGGFTETKCEKCRRALHSRSCRLRHECAS